MYEQTIRQYRKKKKLLKVFTLGDLQLGNEYFKKNFKIILKPSIV